MEALSNISKDRKATVAVRATVASKDVPAMATKVVPATRVDRRYNPATKVVR